MDLLVDQVHPAHPDFQDRLDLSDRLDPSGLLDRLDRLDLQGLQDQDLPVHPVRLDFPDLLDLLVHQDPVCLDQDLVPALVLAPAPALVLVQVLVLAQVPDQAVLDLPVPELPDHLHLLHPDQTVLQNHRYLFVRCHPDLRRQEYHHCFYPSNSNLLSRYLVRFQKHHPVLPLYL